MNNYDDIKRFKEKLNLEGIDYKEIAESNPTHSTANWAIIKQVATADEPFHPLEQGQSTVPTPAPVGRGEFSAERSAPPAAGLRGTSVHTAQAQPPAPSFAAPLLNAISDALPDRPVTASAAPAGDAQPAIAASRVSSLFGAPAAAQTPAPARQASPSAADAVTAPATNLSSLFGAPTAPAPRAQPAAPAPLAPAVSTRTDAPVTGKRFTNLFNRGSASSANDNAGRDTSLSLLLENIALCR